MKSLIAINANVAVQNGFSPQERISRTGKLFHFCAVTVSNLQYAFVNQGLESHGPHWLLLWCEISKRCAH